MSSFVVPSSFVVTICYNLDAARKLTFCAGCHGMAALGMSLCAHVQQPGRLSGSVLPAPFPSIAWGIRGVLRAAVNNLTLKVRLMKAEDMMVEIRVLADDDPQRIRGKTGNEFFLQRVWVNMPGLAPMHVPITVFVQDMAGIKPGDYRCTPGHMLDVRDNRLVFDARRMIANLTPVS